VRDFKFLSDNDEDEDDDLIPLEDNSPSWMWVSHWPESTNLPHEVMITHHEGIREFLGMFPEYAIIPVLKITGYRNQQERTHTGVEEYGDGWGFDITSDLLTIEWVRFNAV
jgi:hypothetical protein